MPPPMPYALIGSPIDASPSPAMHNAAFEALGMNASYKLRPTEPEHAEDVMAEMRHGKWVGINVTTPLKTILAPMVKLVGHAERAGAVNTIWRYGSELHGALTDIDGILQPLEEAGYTGGGEALIIGNGGAARAAVIALDEMGTTIHVASRNPDKARGFLDAMAPAKKGESCTLSNQEALKAVMAKASVVVQATPVGQAKDRHDLPWKSIGKNLIAFEMVYTPTTTPFLAEATKAGAAIIEGWQMLLAQGAASQKIWTGRQAPVEAMAKALREQLGL